MKTTINKKIILVGPGYLPIPIQGTNGWGGIENTLTHIINEFENRGQNYYLVNDKVNYKKLVNDVSKTEHSIVHVHYDDYAPELFLDKNFLLISTSHSPYHPFKQLWQGGVFNHFNTLFNNIDGYFGQSDISNKNALELNSNLKLGLCRCGISEKIFENTRKHKGNKKSLVIGKIEPRKNQTFLQKVFSQDLEIDFVGQCADPNFETKNIGKTNYLGVWSREDVKNKMTEYSSLILLSSFEGDVGVVKEALASGCSIIVSKSASLNLDESKPFIKIYEEIKDKNQFINDVNKINEENEEYRSQIFDYFKNNFDVSVTVEEYLSGLKQYE